VSRKRRLDDESKTNSGAVLPDGAARHKYRL